MTKKNTSRKRAVKTKESPNGKGVYAQKKLKKDSVIGEVKGEITDSDEVDPRYLMELDGDMLLRPKAPFAISTIAVIPIVNSSFGKTRTLTLTLARDPYLSARCAIFLKDSSSPLTTPGRQTLPSRVIAKAVSVEACLLYTSPSPRDKRQSRMPSSA